MISDMINQSDHMETVDTARNGLDALEKVKRFNPDVVTLDVEMPKMDGLSALKRLMKEYPVPVIMLSSLTGEGTDSTIQAIEYGAVDFITKPSGAISLNIEEVKDQLIHKITAAATANVKQESRHNSVQTHRHQELLYEHSIVSIGVSTGGPKALQTLMQQLPQDFSAPILIVQHMPPRFTQSLARRLDQISHIPVKEAENGEVLKKGNAYVAPGGLQFEVKPMARSLVANISEPTIQHGHIPSVNQLFQSLANIDHYNLINVVLTGMGTDGSIGAQTIERHSNSYFFIAESEDTAVIDGMPKSLKQTVQVNAVLPIDRIAQMLSKLVQ